MPVAESGLCTTLRTVGQRRRGKPADVSSPDRRCFSATFVWRRYLGSPAVLLTSFVAARFRAWSLASNAREFKSNFDPHLKAQKKEKKMKKTVSRHCSGIWFHFLEPNSSVKIDFRDTNGEERPRWGNRVYDVRRYHIPCGTGTA